jgi:hypothetical protein
MYMPVCISAKLPHGLVITKRRGITMGERNCENCEYYKVLDAEKGIKSCCKWTCVKESEVKHG